MLFVQEGSPLHGRISAQSVHDLHRKGLFSLQLKDLLYQPPYRYQYIGLKIWSGSITDAESVIHFTDWLKHL